MIIEKISVNIDDNIKDLNVYIGENAQDNWDIITRSKQNDIWFHLDGLSSPHVILEVADLKTIPKQILIKCCNLCKEYSKYKTLNKINVIYTEVKNISKSGTVGTVITKKTKKISV